MSISPLQQYHADHADQAKDCMTHVAGGGKPTLAGRVKQTLAVLLTTHLFAALLAGAFAGGTVALGCSLRALPTADPLTFLSVAIGLPVFAVLLAAPVALRRVYLAQQVGAVAGLLAAPAVLGEFWLLTRCDLPVYCWPAVAVGGAVVGMLGGLRVAGELVERDDVSFQKLDQWDQDARPVGSDLKPLGAAPMRRLLWGIGVGVLSRPVMTYVLYAVFLPVVGNRGTAWTMVARPWLLWEGMAVFLGAFIAGSRTRAGLVQGALAGLAIFFVHQWPIFYTARSVERFAVTAALTGVLCLIAGPLGRKLLPPFRLYKHEADQNLIAEQAKHEKW